MRKIDFKRRMDGTKLLWHMDRVSNRFDKGKRIPPIHIDMGISKFCNIKCEFCVSGTTKILMADFTWKEIRNVKIGDKIIGFDENRNPDPNDKNYAMFYHTTVTQVFKRVGRTHKIEYDGVSLRITAEHPVLCAGHRWRTVKKLKDKDNVRYFCKPYDTEFNDNCFYKLGYLKGVLEGDGTLCVATDKRENRNNYVFKKLRIQMNDIEAINRIESYFVDLFGIKLSKYSFKCKSKDGLRDVVSYGLRTDKIKEVEMIKLALEFRSDDDVSNKPFDYIRGYLAGIFDAEGSNDGNVLRIAQRFHKSVVNHIEQSLKAANYDYVYEETSFRIIGGYEEMSRFFGQCKPAITRKMVKMYNHSIPKTVEVKKYLNGYGGTQEDVYNLETESKTYVANGFCLHNCYANFQNIKPVFIKKEPLLQAMKDAAAIGVKSIGIIGDGEPTMNPVFYEALIEGKRHGLDMATSTNGVLVDNVYKMMSILNSCTWMRFCLSAGTREGYKKIHGKDYFDKVVQNIKDIVKLKKMNGLKCEIGLQAVFDPLTMKDEMIAESKLAVELGVDYLVIKQCSLPDNGESGIKQFDVNMYDSQEVIDALKLCESYSNSDTEIIPKWNTMHSKGIKDYKHCPSISLISEISGDGSWYPCGYMFGNKPEFEKYKFGNIHENSLYEIFNSERYWQIVQYMETEFNSQNDCKGCCRQDACNRFCHDYINKPKGINFV